MAVKLDTITYVWVGGAVLALLLFLVGPDDFLATALGALDRLEDAFHHMLFFLGTQAFNVVRAIAIALFVVFFVLGIVAAQRGLKAVGAMTVVTIGYLILVWRPDAAYPGSIARWFTALLLALVGALVMTQRLMAPPPRPRPPGAWPPPPPPGRPV